MSEEIDRAVRRYRDELSAEVELAERDLDEIEDHLRSLTEELREGGLPTAAALAEACRRLGDPRPLAREHARVRSPFGIRLSRLRAWSAAALLMPFLVSSALSDPANPHGLLELVLGAALVAALVARLSWARPLIVGALVPSIAWLAFAVWVVDAPARLEAQAACYLGALFILLPWRLGEITRSALPLVLLGPAYGAAAIVFDLQLTRPDGTTFGQTTAIVAFAGVLLGAGGALLRARWAALAAAAAALALSGSTLRIWPLEPRLAHGGVFRVMLLASLALGALASAAAAALAWRHARSTLGNLEGLRKA